MTSNIAKKNHRKLQDRVHRWEMLTLSCKWIFNLHYPSKQIDVVKVRHCLQFKRTRRGWNTSNLRRYFPTCMGPSFVRVLQLLPKSGISIEAVWAILHFLFALSTYIIAFCNCPYTLQDGQKQYLLDVTIPTRHCQSWLSYSSWEWYWQSGVRCSPIRISGSVRIYRQ